MTSKRWRISVLLFVCALTLRAMVPSGYMPDMAKSGDGAFQLVFCRGGTIEPAAGGGELPAGLPDHGALCALAGLGAALTVPVLAGGPPVGVVREFGFALQAFTVARGGASIGSVGARGPPALLPVTAI